MGVKTQGASGGRAGSSSPRSPRRRWDRPRSGTGFSDRSTMIIIFRPATKALRRGTQPQQWRTVEIVKYETVKKYCLRRGEGWKPTQKGKRSTENPTVPKNPKEAGVGSG